MGEPREIHMQGKLCDICGAVGYEELTRICSQCTIQRHTYCMPVLVRNMPEYWVCEVCLPKNDTGSFKSGQKEDVLDSSREVGCDLGRQVECKRKKAVETGKVKFLPTNEVIKLSSGTPKKGISLKSYFGSNSVPAKFSTSQSKRTFMGSKTVDPNVNPIKVKINPTFLQLGSLNPPRHGGVQISSSILQHVVTAPKKSKESAHVVLNKENVCKGQIFDAILPDKDLSILQSKNKESTRSSLPSPSRLRTSIAGSGQKFHQAVEYENSDVVAERETWNQLKNSLYRPYLPALCTTWTGGFKILDTATPGEFYGGFLAQPPCRVHRKAYELSQKIPPVLQVNLLQQYQLQADLFQNGCLDLCDIALYFFPVDYMERSQNFNRLFQLMANKNSVMISYIDGVELLIFTSKQLPADSRDVFTRSSTDFFGGVFRHAKDNQMKVHQKLPSFVSQLEYTDDNANTGSSEAVDMDIDMVGGKIVGIPDIYFQKESTQEFNKWDAKETLDATRNGRFSSVSGDLNSVIEPTSLESKRECCNLPSTSSEKIKSNFNIEPVEHHLESSLGRLPGSIGEIVVPPGFEVRTKPNPSDGAPKAPSVEEKIDLGERQIMSQVKEEIGCQGILQVASGVGRPQSCTEDASLQGSKKHQKVLADHLINDPSAACSPPPCLIGEGSKVVSVKIEGNGNEKFFQRIEKKGLQDPAFLSKDDSQIVGSCAVKFNKWDAKETLDATKNGRFSSVSGDLNSVIEPTSLESERGCCNVPSTSTEKIKSKFTIEPVEHPLESSLGRLPGSIGEIDVPPGFEVRTKPNPSDGAPKAPSVEEKIDLGERQIMSQVKEEIGCQGILQVASGVGRPQSCTEDASLRGSKKQKKVLADHLINDPSATCSPPPCLIGERSKVVSVKIEGNDNEKPFQRIEKKGLQDPAFLSKDNSQTVGSCAVEVKAEVQGLANDPSSVCPHLLGKKTKVGSLIKTQEYDKEKPDETRGKKGLEAGSFDGPCAVVDKAKMQKVKLEVNTSHRLHTTLPSTMDTSLFLGPFASARVRLSVAGRSSCNPGVASAGGLIRDESGRWIVGYRVNLGFCGSLATDLWALFQGIKFTWDKGYRKVLVESDSAAAVESLKKAPSPLNSNRALIERCRSLLDDEWDCKVIAIRREENLCATWLATHAEGKRLGLSIINSQPSELIPLLEHDSIRVRSYSSFSIC